MEFGAIVSVYQYSIFNHICCLIGVYCAACVSFCRNKHYNFLESSGNGGFEVVTRTRLG